MQEIEIKKLEEQNEILKKIINDARFIIERAYFDTFDPFHKKLEYARIEWLDKNKKEK
jgi:hypothetical protein